MFSSQSVSDAKLQWILPLLQFKIMLLKKDEHSKASLLANLKKINSHLVRNTKLTTDLSLPAAIGKILRWTISIIWALSKQLEWFFSPNANEASSLNQVSCFLLLIGPLVLTILFLGQKSSWLKSQRQTVASIRIMGAPYCPALKLF